MKIEQITIKRGVSRGRDTYGYNIVTAVSSVKSYRCMGGSYDMLGTVLADWFDAEHQQDLVALASGLKLKDYVAGHIKTCPDLYGLYVRETGSVYLNGACGLSCVIKIIQACGYTVDQRHNKNGRTESFLIYKE